MFKLLRDLITRPASLFHLVVAWRARAQGQCAEAAEAYAAAVAQCPGATNLRVQWGNMLKDSGQLDDAEGAYLGAIMQDPLHAEAHLQLGHLRKLAGRRDLALAAYRQAVALNPRLAAARRELLAAGDPPELLAAFERQLRDGGPEALLSVRRRLDELGDQISALRRLLPDAAAAVAYPIDAYSDMRRLFDVPRPSDARGSSPALETKVVILINADAAGATTAFHKQFTAAREQIYANWQIRVVGSDPHRRVVVERAAAGDPRIQWFEARPETGTADEYAAAKSAVAEWILLLGPGARPHPLTLAWISAVAERTGCQAAVFDEEVETGDGPWQALTPELRRIVDYDTLLEANVYGETVAVSATALDALGERPLLQSLSSARSELLLALAKAHPIAHIPLPLIRRSETSAASPQSVVQTHAAAVRAHLGDHSDICVRDSTASTATITALSTSAVVRAPIGVVIPTKDNLLDLKSLVESLKRLSKHPDRVRVLILNNGAKEFRVQLEEATAEFSDVEITDVTEPFNWSRLSNIGATTLEAPYLIFANDDMKMLTQDWDVVVTSLLDRPGVGALGARLLYPDDTVQHAGILFDWRGSVIHDGLYEPKEAAGPGLRWHVTRSVSAVTGAFLATRREVFDAVGGFDAEHMAVSYSDVDFALKVRARGMRILWTPLITLYHFESKTRGLDHLHPAKAARDSEEQRVLKARWPNVLDFEPSANPFWQSATLPHRLLGFPSRERVWAYLEATSAKNPWRLPPPRETSFG